MKILATGLNGLIGSRILELLKDKYTFENISRSTGVDITSKESVQKSLQDLRPDFVLHLAAYTNVKQAELDRNLGEKSEAWKINVLGTENVAQVCEENNIPLIYFSTDLVFDGENTPEGGYTERDRENPLNWYAQTKYEGELRVKNIKTLWTITRVAYPYRANYEKNDFVRLFIQKLKNKEQLTVLKDRIITPTFIDDIATAVDILIENSANGIYHVVGDTSLSIYDAALEIANVSGLDKSLIASTTRAEFLIDKPKEPYNSSLNNNKIKKLGVNLKTFREGLEEIKRQLNYNI